MNDFMIDLSGPMMMPSEGMGAHPDAKQRVELSKEGVCPAAEPPKPKVRPFGFVNQSQWLFALPTTPASTSSCSPSMS